MTARITDEELDEILELANTWPTTVILPSDKIAGMATELKELRAKANQSRWRCYDQIALVGSV